MPDIRKVPGACDGTGDQLSVAVLGVAPVLVLVLHGRAIERRIQSQKSLNSSFVTTNTYRPTTQTDHKHIQTDHIHIQTDHTEHRDSKTLTGL